ncbi:MAG: hypothetical protein RLZZ441_91 [Actinomycetota bacterium]|jgi:hypothetical protein
MNKPTGIDPRGPRFGATITAVLLLVDVFISIPLATAPINVEANGYVLLVVLSGIFLWGAVGGVQQSPYGLFFAKFIRPRLKSPEFVESPAGPTFSQAVGFIVTISGVLLYLAGIPAAVPVAAAFAFVAAFLNAAFGYCLGCEIYLLFAKRGITFGLEKPGTPRTTRVGSDHNI